RPVHWYRGPGPFHGHRSAEPDRSPGRLGPDRPDRSPGRLAVTETAGVPEGPVPSSQQGQRLLDLVKVMARLRGPGGCPWDREQDHRSLARHLLEESHEVLEAIDDGDPAKLRDELGDLLLQVVFHAQMAAEAETFDIDGVAEGI